MTKYSKFQLDVIAKALMYYHAYLKFSSTQGSFSDIVLELYVSPATKLKLPDGFWEQDGDAKSLLPLELKEEALRRFGCRENVTLSDPKCVEALVALLMDVGFLRLENLENEPKPAHHIECDLAKLIGEMCFDTPEDVYHRFFGEYHGVQEDSDGSLVEVLLMMCVAPGNVCLIVRETLLRFNRRSNEPASHVDGRRFRLQMDDVTTRFGTARLSCQKNLEVCFASIEGDDVDRPVEASRATMRSVAYNAADTAKPICFELHGDHPFYSRPVAKFERIDGKQLLNRQMRIEAELAKWCRRT